MVHASQISVFWRCNPTKFAEIESPLKSQFSVELDEKCNMTSILSDQLDSDIN